MAAMAIEEGRKGEEEKTGEPSIHITTKKKKKNEKKRGLEFERGESV